MDSDVWTENKNREDARTRDLLKKWDGGEAAICHAQTGHKILHLCVMFREKRGFLEIRCGDCEFLSGPFRWTKASFELIEQPDPNDRVRYILRDERNNFFVKCGLVAAEEMYVD